MLAALVFFLFSTLSVHVLDIYFNKTNTLRFSWWDIGNQKCSTSPVEGSEWIVSKRPQIKLELVVSPLNHC